MLKTIRVANHIQPQYRLLILITLSVFFAEAFVIIILSGLPSFSIWIEALLDSSVLIILLSPVLYFGFFRTLVQNIAKREKAEGELKKHRDHLEELVVKRTAELTAANEKLKQEIAERISAEGALRESEAQYRLLVDNLQEGVWQIDKESYTTYVNPRMAEMLGYSVDEMKGKHLFSYMDEQGIEICKRNLERRKQGIREQHDFELLHKDGSRLYTSMATTPIKDESGNYIGALASVADITQRVHAEEELRKRTHDLSERVKELNCLYSISKLIEKRGISLEEIIQGIVDLIPSSWQYPEITCARVVLTGREFTTQNFRDTYWKQQTRILAYGNPIGLLEVCYGEEKPECDEGSFLKEERELLSAISERIGRIIERVKAEESLQRELGLNEALSDLYKPLISPSASIKDMALTVLDKAKELTSSEHGYVSSINPTTGDMIVHTHTEMLKRKCRLTGENRRIIFSPQKDGRYPNLWGHSLNSLEPFYTNSPATHEASKGVPEGHISLNRFLSIPVMLREELVGQIALANKGQDYTEWDLEAANRVAEFYALAIERNRSKEALLRARDELEKRVEERTAEIKIANENLKKEIQERKLAQAQLQISKATLQSIFDGISDPLVLLDKELQLKMLNQAAKDYYGIDEYRDVLGEKCYEAITGKLEPCEGCQVPEAISKDQYLTFERIGFMDSERLEQVIVYPIRGADKELSGTILRISDITEAKIREKQIIQAEKLASLGLLVSGIAHEINNPNNFISFNVPILKEYLEALIPIVDDYAADRQDFEMFGMRYAEFREDALKIIDNIAHGSNRIDTIVSGLKRFAGKRGKEEKQWIDLKQVIEKTVAISRGQIRKKVKSLEIDIPENLPDIHTDPEVVEQVLINLMVNAVQAADKDDSWVKLNVALGDTWQDHVFIEVSDNGCGMDETTMENIFSPFFTTKASDIGTGLGLYICQDLIKGLGGRIDVKSEAGKGSVFTVILPDYDRRSMTRLGG